jgi:diaminopimelate decarboxylase
MTGSAAQVTKNSVPFSIEMATALLNTYGSPLYVYQQDQLLATINHITKSIPYPHTQFHFASVTNGNIALLQIFQEQGWGIHANTPGDIYLGLQAGFTPDRIVYSGSNLSRPEMRQVLAGGIHTINLDSLSQLQLLCDLYCADYAKPQLGLRLNYPALTGNSRIGVHPDEFAQAIAITKSAGLTLDGLHFYRGTGTNATKAFTDAIDTVISLATQLPDWSYLDFGGGFGYPYQPDGAAFDWLEFGQVLSDRLASLSQNKQFKSPLQLAVEPGRAVIAGCAVLLARVVSTKWQEQKQIIGVDTTVANLSVPSVHGGYRQIVTWPDPAVLIPDHKLFTTDVCGNTTYSRDYLGRNCLLPRLNIDDIVGILDVGAYGYAMSSHFLHRPRPAEVLIKDHQHQLIRHREDYEILKSHQTFRGQ